MWSPPPGYPHGHQAPPHFLQSQGPVFRRPLGCTVSVHQDICLTQTLLAGVLSLSRGPSVPRVKWVLTFRSGVD